MLNRIALVTVLCLVGCGAPAWQQAPHDRPFQKEAPPQLHEKPRETEVSGWYESIYHGTFAQWARVGSPGHYIQKSGGGHEALDVNAFGNVPDSTWFENRIGRRRLSLEEMRRGPNRLEGPAPGKLVISRVKSKGVTPGLFVTDSKGERWVIKFDEPAHPGLSSGAEVVTTKLLWAAGYHVPENYVSFLRLDQLELGEGVTTRNKFNQKLPLTQKKLERIIAQLNALPDGRIRAMFSRFLPGEPVGPFSLVGVRDDDPNDRIPHERRRSLRGLWLFYAWLNSTDAKGSNTLDMFVRVGDADQGYLKHHLIDFGNTLGATGRGPKYPGQGYEHMVDWEAMAGRAVTLGFQYPYWYGLQASRFRSVGLFESEVFDPARWRPQYPSPGFEAADVFDTFWAGAIIARLGPAEIAAAVASGRYTEPGAAEHLTQVLVERRQKVLAHAFARMLPLDNPRIEGKHRVVLTDLSVLAALRPPDEPAYEWRLLWHHGRKTRRITGGVKREPTVHLGSALSFIRQHYGRRSLERHPFLTLSWSAAGKVRPRVELRLRVRENGSLLPVGLERVPSDPK